MLLFNIIPISIHELIANFNTSNVTIQPPAKQSISRLYIISIHLMLLFNIM